MRPVASSPFSEVRPARVSKRARRASAPAGLARWLVVTIACVLAPGCDDDPRPRPCVPSCAGAECGTDGCGGSCGECEAPFECSWWACLCPAGTLACGGTCCEGAEVCRGGACCTRDCTGRRCGDDGCGGTCAPGCAFGEVCEPELGACASAWIAVRAGSFLMGSPEHEAGRWQNESVHEVTLTRDFEIYAREISRSEFSSIMDYEPPALADCGGECPVTFVTWHEAAAFCNALSDREGLEACYSCAGEGSWVECGPSPALPSPYACPGYRLPTEAEWEYAARAGTTTATPNGDLAPAELGCASPSPVLDPIAWHCGNSATGAAPAGTEHPGAALEANRWGLFDVLGNVAEWCHDACPTLHFACADYDWGAAIDPSGSEGGHFRVVRGGGWASNGSEVRSAYRTGDEPGLRTATWGFRPARSLE